MITSHIAIQIKDSVDDAPKYEAHEYTMIKATAAIVVARGTNDGNPTVDIQFLDARGNKYVMLATGGIIESLGKIVEVKRIQTNTH